MTTRKWTKAQKQAHSETMRTNWAKRKAKQASTNLTHKGLVKAIEKAGEVYRRTAVTEQRQLTTPRYITETARKIDALSAQLADLASDLRMLAL